MSERNEIPNQSVTLLGSDGKLQERNTVRQCQSTIRNAAISSFNMDQLFNVSVALPTEMNKKGRLLCSDTDDCILDSDLMLLKRV